MNRVILVGRLARDPEKRVTQSGKSVVSMVLAVDRRFSRKARENGQQTADFISLVAWDKLADVCANNLEKGRRIGIEGRLQTRSYEAKDGSKRYVTEVVMDEMEFLDSRNEQGQGARSGGYDSHPSDSYAQSAPADQGALGSESVGEEDIPF